VVKPCCCAFGKFIQSSATASFTKHEAWSGVINAHNAVHTHLTDYASGRVGATILTDVDSATQEIFTNLTKVIDSAS